MDKITTNILRDFPEFSLVPGDIFYWSSRTKEIFYRADGNPASLLHELGHALLAHQAFTTDLDLLAKEVAAWEKAQELATRYGIDCATDTIERCLDTYRDWLHTRSTCPTCGNHGIQPSNKLYSCLNCGKMWNVSTSVLCRAYRQSKGALTAK